MVRRVQLAPGVSIFGNYDVLPMPVGPLDPKLRFVEGRAVGEIKIAAAPEWLLDQLVQILRKGRRGSSATGGNPVTLVKTA